MKVLGSVVGIALSIGLHSCKQRGCTDPFANNYVSTASHDDGTCTYDDPAGTISLTIGNTCSTLNGLDFSAGVVECAGCSQDTAAVASDIRFSEPRIEIVPGDSCWGKDSLSIVSLGTICCLGEINEIPISGFSDHVSPGVNHGYIVKTREGKYGRMFIDEFIFDSFGALVGAKLRVQYPFQP